MHMPARMGPIVNVVQETWCHRNSSFDPILLRLKPTFPVLEFADSPPDCAWFRLIHSCLDLSGRAAKPREAYVIDPDRSADLIVQTLAQLPRDSNENQARFWPRGEFDLFEGPRFSSSLTRGSNIQVLRVFRIHDLKPHSALGRDLVGAQISLKTITRIWRNQHGLE